MVAYPKVQGSLLLKVIIVILAGVLVYAIYLPNKIWTIEQAEEDECRFRLIALNEAQSQFYTLYEAYADSIETIMNLAAADEHYHGMVDSLIQIISRQDSINHVKLSQPLRPYHLTHVPLDSIYTCPATGAQYVLTSGEPGEYQISCPVESHSIRILLFFRRQIANHGWINQKKVTSW